MKYLLLAASIAAWLHISHAADSGLDMHRLKLVGEYHADLQVDEVGYTLDSYIVPQHRPYYVKVSRADYQPMKVSEASRVAMSYIQPRACTQPASRRTYLDRSSSDETLWIVGVVC